MMITDSQERNGYGFSDMDLKCLLPEFCRVRLPVGRQVLQKSAGGIFKKMQELVPDTGGL